MIENDNNIDFVSKILKKCISGSYCFRVLKANIVYDRKDKIRPLWVKDRDSDSPRDNIADCENARYLFNFKPKFVGRKRRTIIIIDA